MEEKRVSWVEKNAWNLISLMILIMSFVFIYGRLNSDVDNLKEIRKSDKQDITKAVEELKNEVSNLRKDLVALIKEMNKHE